MSPAVGPASTPPQSASDWLALSRRHEQRGEMSPMFVAAQRALQLEPASLDARFREIECLIVFGRTRVALQRLVALEPDCAGDAVRMLQAGAVYSRLNRIPDYHRCYARAFDLARDDRNARLNLARSFIVLGDLGRAQELLEDAIRAWPQDHEAWHALARLRKWTADDNHVETLERLAGNATDPASKVAFCYALHKELEDLGEDERAMQWLKLGARTLRGTLSYRPETDAAVMESIARNFPASRVRAAPRTGLGLGAIFVIGLPRSGTTMVDRILSAHRKVESLGELRDLTYAVMTGGGTVASSPQAPAARPAAAGMQAIGRCYMDAVATYRGDRPCFVDKAPMNFLYAGLIRLALPGARIVLLRRDPMDSCLAIHKTLFREGSPFACDLEDLGRYYLAWHRLAEHWTEALGDAMLTVEYESLVRNQEAETRRMLGYCGLEWDPACLDFHLNASPTATASAAQVRQPLYSTSIGRWKRHAADLEPLARVLTGAGIAIG
ncbi:MAG TPA: sulfotransferase [Steroidobacteraceae bacterium]|nr:sulfotransferase [Steroidobacteraceae bacterium]HQR47958.1 sulfotransferase [Steroidobacteraceae bacterium]